MGKFVRGRERRVVIKPSYVCMNIQVCRSNKEVQLCCLGKLIIVTCGRICNKRNINDTPPLLAPLTPCVDASWSSKAHSTASKAP